MPKFHWWAAYLHWRALRRIPARTRVLHALASGERHAYEIWQRYRVGSGDLYVILFRLEREGLAHSRWYTGPEGHPDRKGYRLSHRGLRLHSELIGSADWQRLDALVGR